MQRESDHRGWVLSALDQYETRLVRYVRRLMGDEHRARDVVQFVFLKLCEQRSQEVAPRLSQWLYTVSRNRALDLLRTSNHEAATRSDTEFTATTAPRHSREADPAELAEQTDLHSLLRLLVDELPPSQREALDLWADGLSNQEISQVMNKQETHIRVLIHRALKSLRQHPQVQALMADAPQPVPLRP